MATVVHYASTRETGAARPVAALVVSAATWTCWIGVEWLKLADRRGIAASAIAMLVFAAAGILALTDLTRQSGRWLISWPAGIISICGIWSSALALFAHLVF